MDASSLPAFTTEFTKKYIEASKGRIEVSVFDPGATVYHVCRKEVRRGDSSCLWHRRIEWKAIVPDFNDDLLELRYDTGRVIRECPPNSIGALNNLGNETLPLPETLPEIAGLLIQRD